MALEQNDLEAIERLISKSGDATDHDVARSFERMEERIDATESRLYTRLAEIEDRVEASRQDTSDQLGELRDEMREQNRANSPTED
jgi:phage shock protein A